MRRPAIAVFILFFGLATIEALADGRLPRILFWLGMAAAFALADWWGLRRTARPPQ
jgi:hypothetical protein